LYLNIKQHTFTLHMNMECVICPAKPNTARQMLLFILILFFYFAPPRPFQNITEFDGQDGCGTNSWSMVDVDLPQDEAADPRVQLKHLRPWTQYAVFVRAITLQVEDKHVVGAKSEVVYIRTSASRKPPPPGGLCSSSVPVWRSLPGVIDFGDRLATFSAANTQITDAEP